MTTTRKFSIDDYKTAQRAQEAVKMFLVLPDGTPTEDYLLVVGTESKEFRASRYEQEQRGVSIAALETAEQRRNAIDDARYNVLASCIRGWSFDVPFSFDAAKELIAGAPYLADAVDTFISRRSHFFAKPSTTSTRTRKPKQS